MGILNEHLGSGLYEGGHVIFRNPRFTRLPNYMDGQRVLMVADLYDVDEGETIEDQRFTMGAGWIASDDETEIVGHEDGKKLKLNDKTGLGRFCNSLGQMEALDDVLVARVKAGDPGVTPFHVGLYNGLEVTIESHDESFATNEDKEAGKGEKSGSQSFFIVTEFHGYEGDAASSKGNAKPAKAAAKKATKAVAKKAAAKPAPVEEPVEELAGIDEAVIAKITEVAMAANDYDEFVANCYADITEVAEDEVYQKLVEDQGEDGIWGQVVAAWEAENGAG